MVVFFHLICSINTNNVQETLFITNTRLERNFYFKYKQVDFVISFESQYE